MAEKSTNDWKNELKDNSISLLASFGLPRHESLNSKIFFFSFVLSLVLLIANK